MGEDVEQREDTAAPAPAETAAAPSSAPSDRGAAQTSEDLDRFTAEYDAAVGLAGTIDEFFATPSAENVDRIFDADAERESGRALAGQLRDREAADQRTAQLEQAVVELQHREFLRNEHADFDRFVARAEEAINDLEANLPPDFARRFLLAESVTNEKLRLAWDHRNAATDPQTKRVINDYLDGAIQKLRKAVKSMPDPEVTADRLAVIAAVKAAGGKVAPDPPPNFGRMSTKELNRWTENHLGFTAV